MSKAIKEFLTLLIILINISIGIMGISFCFEEMKLHAIITLASFILMQPISYNFLDKLNHENRI